MIKNQAFFLIISTLETTSFELYIKQYRKNYDSI
jgi:hypothetical protein